MSRERLVIQVSEESAELMPLQTTSLATALREFGCGFAIEHFGIGKAPLRLIEQVPMDYLKFDGSLVHGLSGNEDLQQRIGSYICAAQAEAIATIAVGVDDANTMALLWQLGVELVQGDYGPGPAKAGA